MKMLYEVSSSSFFGISTGTKRTFSCFSDFFGHCLPSPEKERAKFPMNMVLAAAYVFH